MDELENYIINTTGCLPATFSDKALSLHKYCGPNKHAAHEALKFSIVTSTNFTKLRSNFSNGCLAMCDEEYYSASIMEEEELNIEYFFNENPDIFDYFYSEYPGQTFFSYANGKTGTSGRMAQGNSDTKEKHLEDSLTYF